MVTPAVQVRRFCGPDDFVAFKLGRSRSVQDIVFAVNSLGENQHIFVIRTEDNAVMLEGVKIFLLWTPDEL